MGARVVRAVQLILVLGGRHRSLALESALVVVRPATVIDWHRRGFAWLWTRRSRSLGGRPKVDAELRRLVREMADANPLWGAPRIHGELLKLCQRSLRSA